MKIILSGLLAIGIFSTVFLRKGNVDEQEAAIETIAFGSCNSQDEAQPLWPAILQNKPNLWIWLGDNIYGDTEDMAEMRRKYDKQNAAPAYKKLKASCPVIGIWDDHDFGKNDADRTYPKAEESKQAMLDFLGVAKDAPQRKRPGAYSSYTAGHGPRQVKIILLDTRTFKDPLVQKDGAYVPDPKASLLGEAQWAWLENELKTSKASVNIIGNGTQVIANEHRFEKWGNFPSERARLFKTIAQSGAKGVLLITGDRHWAELSKIDIAGKPLYDFTSSGMTHTRSLGNEPNKYRVGKPTANLNFGVIKLDWSKNPVEARLQVRGNDDVLHSEEVIRLQ